jgi:hypothetical protein
MVGPGGGEETPKEAKRNGVVGVVPPLFFFWSCRFGEGEATRASARFSGSHLLSINKIRPCPTVIKLNLREAGRK